MLVLSRKVGERLMIGDNITLVINRIAGNRVTIGIEAPSDVRVVRTELKDTEDLDNARGVNPVLCPDLLVPTNTDAPMRQRDDKHRAVQRVCATSCKVSLRAELPT